MHGPLAVGPELIQGPFEDCWETPLDACAGWFMVQLGGAAGAKAVQLLQCVQTTAEEL